MIDEWANVSSGTSSPGQNPESHKMVVCVSSCYRKPTTNTTWPFCSILYPLQLFPLIISSVFMHIQSYSANSS